MKATDFQMVLGELKRISDKQDATNNTVALMDKRLELHAQKTDLELRRIVDLDNAQNKLLDQHILGVNTLKQIHDQSVREFDLRMIALEEPKKLIKLAAQIFVGLGGVAGAITAIYGVYYVIQHGVPYLQ
jgi:hypothetical protein